MTNLHNTAETKKVQSWVEKGQRLQQLRNLGHLKRKEMAEFARVAVNTYKFWELGDSNLIEERASWLIDGLQTIGIECSVEWLLTGVGDPPSKHKTVFGREIANANSAQVNVNCQTDDVDDKKRIVAELECFCCHNLNSIGLIVADNSMAPNYQRDDVVAGIQHRDDDIKKLIGLDCIIKLRNGSILLRNLNAGSKDGVYTLLSTNSQSKLKILHDVEVESVAPILWHRRLNKW